MQEAFWQLNRFTLGLNIREGENKEELGMEILKVSAKSNPNSVAGALAGVLRERGGAEIQAIGAGALNQAVKAVAIARGFVAPSGVDLICIPAFTDIKIDGEERTAIKLIVEPR
jgi:stage V sporulation protein S